MKAWESSLPQLAVQALRLLPFPPGILLGAAKLAGRGGEASRLLGSLQVDSSLIRAELGWTPPFTVSEGLDRTVQWHEEKYK